MQKSMQTNQSLPTIMQINWVNRNYCNKIMQKITTL